ncbi:MAG: TlpA family protein disulfide reductase [Pseudomonadales bacterium]|nr:TlpA family protein disulfide reductase [Pseudomonadales bacterium]
MKIKNIVLFATMMLISNGSFAASSAVAPDFTLKSSAGQNLRLSELKGQVVMINFWASWCGPCRQEMPELNEIQKKYEDLGFTILGVNVEENPTKANELLAENPVDFPILYDTENQVTELFKVDAMPSTILVDRDGNMRYLHKGYKPGYEDLYAQQVKILVRE